MSQEYMPIKPYFVASAADKGALQDELRSLDAQLGTGGERPAPLTFVQESRLTARRKEVKRLLVEIASRETHAAATQRKPVPAPVVEVSDNCGRARRLTTSRRLVVPDHIEAARCSAEKAFASQLREPKYMPPKPPTR